MLHREMKAKRYFETSETTYPTTYP